MDQLLSFIAVSDLSLEEPPEVLQLVRDALAECPEEDPRQPYLLAIEEALADDRIPEAELQEFGQLFPHARPPAEDMEGEFRALAEALSPGEWRSSAISQLEQALLAFDQSEDEDQLLTFLEEREMVICEAIEKYAGTQLSPEEVTCETVTGHRLLLEGLQAWLAALKLVQEAAETGTQWDDAMAEAERGNRLLMAVQRLQQRVAAADV